MNKCMHAWTDCCFVCVCVCVYVYVVGWFGRLVCRVEQSTLTIVEARNLYELQFHFKISASIRCKS